MEESLDLHLSIEAEDAASASRQAQALERLLLEECPSVSVHRTRINQERMDGGAMLAVALASPVLVEFVKTLRAFLLRHKTAKIVVKHGRTSFTVEGGSELQVNALLNFLRDKK
jgi:hypothetical protein